MGKSKPKKTQKIRPKFPDDTKNQSNTPNSSIILTFLVKPGARSDRIYEEDGRLFLDITAPPVKGKANKAIIKFLAKHLDIRMSSIHLIRGETSHTKTFELSNSALTKKEVMARFGLPKETTRNGH